MTNQKGSPDIIFSKLAQWLIHRANSMGEKVPNFIQFIWVMIFRCWQIVCAAKFSKMLQYYKQISCIIAWQKMRWRLGWPCVPGLLSFVTIYQPSPSKSLKWLCGGVKKPIIRPDQKGKMRSADRLSETDVGHSSQRNKRGKATE